MKQIKNQKKSPKGEQNEQNEQTNDWWTNVKMNKQNELFFDSLRVNKLQKKLIIKDILRVRV